MVLTKHILNQYFKQVTAVAMLGFLGLAFSGDVAANNGDTLNRYDDQGKMHGYWMRSNNGVLTYEGRFDHGTPTGLFVYYYPDRSIKSTMYYSDQGRDAKTVMFHQNGSIMAIGKYYDREKDSTWRYYNEYEIQVSSEEYVRGKPHGVWKKYNMRGQVIEKHNYVDGVKHGEWLQYFDNGKLKLRATYVDGFLQGRFMMYFSNDLPSVSGLYERSIPVGVWLYYNIHGKIERKVHYENGVRAKIEHLVPFVEPDSPEALEEVRNFRRQLRNMGLE